MITKCMNAKEWVYFFSIILLVFIEVVFNMKLPDYMSDVTILVQTEGSTMSEILTSGSYMLACAIGALLVTVIVGFFIAQFGATISMRLREKVYNKVMSFSMADKNKFSTGSLITRSTNDITQIQQIVSMGLMQMIKAPLMAVGSIYMISSKNSNFTTATVIAIASLIAVVIVMLFLTIPKTKKIQKLTDDLNTVTREHLTGVRVVRAYNAEGYQEEKFENTNEDIQNKNIFVNRVTSFMLPYMNFLMSALTLAIYWVGTGLMLNAKTDMDKLIIFSDVVVFSSYAMHVIMSFMVLTMVLLMLPRAIVSMGRVKEVLEYENNLKDGDDNFTVSENFPVSLEFRNVCFSYNKSEEQTLNNISFKVNKGETISFIGPTGSGKSTIVNLIMRFYDCTSGEILVDGVNVKEYSGNKLREKLGLVSQKATIFSGDIKSNITFGGDKNIDLGQVDKAVDISQARDFVEKTGIDGIISQGGLNLSGGQKQRLSIARAVYKNPDLYIFDDCFSALDYRTDKMLRNKLNEDTKGKTKVMIAQRISTVKDSDQIVVLENGKVAGIGKHRELLDNCEVYLDIAQSQLSKEELEYA